MRNSRKYRQGPENIKSTNTACDQTREQPVIIREQTREQTQLANRPSNSP